MIQPRFLDTVDVNVRQAALGMMPPDIAATFADPHVASGGGSTLRAAAEQVKQFKYWQYVAVRRIADFASHLVPNFSVPVNMRADGQRYLAQSDRRHVRARYGMLQSMQDDLKPLPSTHPVCELFRTVNPEDSYCEFIYETIIFWMLTGRFYWWKVPNGLGRPSQLWVVPTQSAEELFDNRGVFTGIRIKETQRVIPADQIIKGKFKSPLSKRDSYSEMQAAPLWVNNVESIARSRQATFRQGPNPGMLLHLEGERYQNPKEDELTAIKERFLRRTAGEDRHGEPVLIPPGIKAEKWSHSAKEMDYEKSSEQARDENLALYGVPKTVAGILEDVNRATFEGSLVAFCNIRMNPLMAQLAGIISEKLTPQFDPRIVCWFADCTPANAEQELAEQKADFDMGALSPDERRMYRGRDAIGTPAYQSGYIAAGRVPLNEDLLEDDPADEPAEPPDDETDTDEEDDDQGNQSVLHAGGRKGASRSASPFRRRGRRQSDKAERRERVGRQFGKLHGITERRFIRAQAGFWRELTNRILERLQSAGTPAVNVEELFSAEEHRDSFNRLLLPEWNRSAYAGVSFEAQWIESAEVQITRTSVAQEVAVDIENPTPPPSINVDPSPELQAKIRGFLKERSAGVWDTVGATTHDRLRRALNRGLAEGDSLDDLQARIRKILKSQSNYGARRIARTETTGGMNFGQQAEREDIGIEEKEWVSTIDNRTRGAKPGDAFDHTAANGQVANNSQPFTVSGEQLLFPADGSYGASAGNIIHCRCAAVAYLN